MSSSRQSFNEITPIELLSRLWNCKIWASFILVASLFVSLLYLRTAEPLYQVEANLLLEPNARVLGVGGVKETGRRSTDLTATQSEVITSRELLGRAIKASINGPPTAPEEKQFLDRFSEALTAKPIVGTRIVNLSLRWKDSQQAQEILRNLIDEYCEFLRELEQGGQLEALETLTQTESKIRGELEDLQSEYRELFQSTPLIGAADSGWAVQQALIQDLGAAYTEVRSRRIGLENRFASLDFDGPDLAESKIMPASLSEGSHTDSRLVSTQRLNRDHVLESQSPSERGWGALQMLNDVNLKGLQEPVAIQQELFQAEVRRQDLIEKYLENHPDVRAVEKQIEGWSRRLQTLVDRAPLALERELNASRMQEERLRSLYEEELSKGKQLNAHRLEQQQLQKRIERTETLHSSVVAQLTDLQLTNDATEGGTDLRVTVLQAPTASAHPAWPNRKLVLGGGLLIGLLGCSALVFVPTSARRTSMASS